MGIKSTLVLPRPEGVSAGGTATFRIPVGRRIHELYLAFAYDVATQNLSHFTEIRLYMNSNIFQRYTATQRNTLNLFDGDTVVNGILKIPFDRKGLKSVAAQEETALNTNVPDKNGRKIDSLYMEVDIAAGATISPADLVLSAKVSDAITMVPNAAGVMVPAGPGTIPYLRNEQRTISGADSDFQISDLVNPGVNAFDKIALSRVTFVPSTGNLTNLRIDQNNYELVNRTVSLNQAMQQAGVRSPQSGYYTIDTGENGHGGDLIDLLGMTDYRYRLAADAAMTVTVLSEYFGSLPG